MFSPQRIEELMKEAIDLAWKHEEGIYRPYVGALVLSSEGEIIARGTKRFIPGTHTLYVHAERDALHRVVGRTQGGTLVTTLEPCMRIRNRSQILSPCIELIVEAGLRSVIIGMRDSADSVNGRGINYLRWKDIHVEVYHGPLENELERIYRVRRLIDTYINTSLAVK